RTYRHAGVKASQKYTQVGQILAKHIQRFRFGEKSYVQCFKLKKQTRIETSAFANLDRANFKLRLILVIHPIWFANQAEISTVRSKMAKHVLVALVDGHVQIVKT